MNGAFRVVRDELRLHLREQIVVNRKQLVGRDRERGRERETENDAARTNGNAINSRWPHDEIYGLLKIFYFRFAIDRHALGMGNIVECT